MSDETRECKQELGTNLCPSFRGYGVVSMCIGTGMGAAAVFEYPGK